jgi:hypothetical protein
LPPARITPFMGGDPRCYGWIRRTSSVRRPLPATRMRMPPR